MTTFKAFLDCFPLKAQHMLKGKCGHPHDCAISLALNDKFNAHDSRIEPYYYSAVVIKNHELAHSVELSFSPKSLIWIQAYDAGLLMAPCIMFLNFWDYGKAKLFQKIEMQEDGGFNKVISWSQIQDMEDIYCKS